MREVRVSVRARYFDGSREPLRMLGLSRLIDRRLTAVSTIYFVHVFCVSKETNIADMFLLFQVT